MVIKDQSRMDALDVAFRDARSKLERGERMSREELVALHDSNVRRLSREIEPDLKAGKVASAISVVLQEMAAISISNRLAREVLEDRVAALEPKPRVRVQAPTRPSL